MMPIDNVRHHALTKCHQRDAEDRHALWLALAINSGMFTVEIGAGLTARSAWRLAARQDMRTRIVPTERCPARSRNRGGRECSGRHRRGRKRRCTRWPAIRASSSSLEIGIDRARLAEPLGQRVLDHLGGCL